MNRLENISFFLFHFAKNFALLLKKKSVGKKLQKINGNKEYNKRVRETKRMEKTTENRLLHFSMNLISVVTNTQIYIHRPTDRPNRKRKSKNKVFDATWWWFFIDFSMRFIFSGTFWLSQRYSVWALCWWLCANEYTYYIFLCICVHLCTRNTKSVLIVSGGYFLVYPVVIIH